MEGYYPVRIKRKELEHDFSFSSPASKIRRLDAELPSIIEEQEPDIPMVFSQSEPLNENNGYVVGQGGGGGGSVVIGELENSSPPVNEERAIVLFNPMDTTLLRSPSTHSFSVSPNFISDLKNQVLRSSSHSNLLRAPNSETEKKDDRNGCLSVIPWVPMHLRPGTKQQVVEAAPQVDMCETMEAEDETGVASMDIEENYIGVDQGLTGSEFGSLNMLGLVSSKLGTP